MTDTILSTAPGIATTKRNYSILAQGFHWLTALLMFSILPVAWIMVLLPKTDPNRDTWYTTHKSLGITILALTVLRILWRAIKTPPPLPGRAAAWERLLSKITHWLLYFILFAMPVSGYLLSAAGNHEISMFGLFDLPLIPENKTLSDTAVQIHLSLQWLVYALIILHLAGTWWHIFLRRDGLLERMLPRQVNAD